MTGSFVWVWLGTFASCHTPLKKHKPGVTGYWRLSENITGTRVNIVVNLFGTIFSCGLMWRCDSSEYFELWDFVKINAHKKCVRLRGWKHIICSCFMCLSGKMSVICSLYQGSFDVFLIIFWFFSFNCYHICFIGPFLLNFFLFTMWPFAYLSTVCSHPVFRFRRAVPHDDVYSIVWRQKN